MTTLKAIVAMAENRVIGKDGDLPWRISEDLKWFKKLTLGSPVIMGRKTMDSIGRPLPGRRNIVLSRSLKAPPDGFGLADSWTSIESLIEGEESAFVIGGAEIYRLLVPNCQELYLSLVFGDHEGDTTFPPLEEAFTLEEVLHRDDDFELRRYLRR